SAVACLVLCSTHHPCHANNRLNSHDKGRPPVAACKKHRQLPAAVEASAVGELVRGVVQDDWPDSRTIFDRRKINAARGEQTRQSVRKAAPHPRCSLVCHSLGSNSRSPWIVDYWAAEK